MRNKKAKQLRKLVYGKHAYSGPNNRNYEVVATGKRRIKTKDNRLTTVVVETVKAIGNRRFYQDLKKVGLQEA